MKQIGDVRPPPKVKRHSANAEQPPPHKRRRRTAESDPETVTREPDPSSSNRFSAFASPASQEQKPSSREWALSPCSSASSAYRDKFVIVSYNILGVENANNHPDLYLKVSPKYLEWSRRRRLIRKEIKRYDASILCLQEVDRFDDLAHRFQKYGLDGVYKARTGEARDGCATFWKKDMFTLLHQENIEFQRFGLRHNVAQFCVLKSNQNQLELDMPLQTSVSSCTHSRTVVIGNIHVLYNPNRGDIKLGQVRLFLEKAYQLSQEWGNIPVVLSGDMNSIPQSPMYQFLASSELDIRLHNSRHISGQVNFESQRAFRWQNQRENSRRYGSRPLSYRWSAKEVQLATGSKRTTCLLQHHLNLSSAYFGVPGSRETRDTNGEPLATSYHSKFMGTCDYIWHTDELVPVRVLETLPVNILKRDGGLPSKRWGSDHLALVCELAFIDNASTG